MLILQAIRKGFLSIYSKYAYWWNNNKSIFFILFIYAWYWDVALFVPWVMITRSWPFFSGWLSWDAGRSYRTRRRNWRHALIYKQSMWKKCLNAKRAILDFCRIAGIHLSSPFLTVSTSTSNLFGYHCLGWSCLDKNYEILYFHRGPLRQINEGASFPIRPRLIRKKLKP